MPEYHYIQSEPGLWTVGTGRPGKGGDWEPESDHESREAAARRVAFLNGGVDVEDRVLRSEMLDVLKVAYEMLEEAIEYVPGGRQRIETINARNMVHAALIKAKEAVDA